MFEDSYDKILSHFSDWIQVVDSNSKWTIEDFPYDKGVDELQTYLHCWKCVTVNKCWFKNEGGKKPQTMSYDGGYGVYPKSKRGLYHLNCHCKERAINVPRLKDVSIINIREKFNDFFKRKKGILYGLGYTSNDQNEIIKMYADRVKNSYRRGDYVLYKHWRYGYQINIKITISSKNNGGVQHFFNTGVLICPNGKLKIATVFAGGVQ